MNIGVLITDHNVEETLCITDRAYMLFEGRILFKGKPEELAENPIVRARYLTNSFVLRPKDFEAMERERIAEEAKSQAQEQASEQEEDNKTNNTTTES
jgi:lipopolysaccharide export system ATP-binding protein